MHMSSLYTSILIQLFGMMGVIGSLISVGLEMRQSQRIALVNQMQQSCLVHTHTVNPKNYYKKGFEILTYILVSRL